MVVNAFPGRVIFDHFPKTAGQAVNSWLISELGTGSVTPNLIGSHHDLIRQYGGVYTIISGHVDFPNAGGLDPRYHYITLFREPVDRAISWLYFLVKNHDEAELSELWVAAKAFWDSDGEQLHDILLDNLANTYVKHLCSINTIQMAGEEVQLENALALVPHYAVVGIYEDMQRFIDDTAELIGIPSSKGIARVNVVASRPKAEQISPALRARIVQLNQLDIRFYEALLLVKESEVRSDAIASTMPHWDKYDVIAPENRVFTTPELTVIDAHLKEAGPINYGQLVTFDVRFAVAKDIHDLEMGIHIYDAERRCVFGVNSTLLGHARHSILSGTYQVSHLLIAHLPSGKYTAGFVFSECFTDRKVDLAWHDALCEFEVVRETPHLYAGTSYLPSEMSLTCITLIDDIGYHFNINDPRLQTIIGHRDGTCIATTGRAGHLIYGPYVCLDAGKYQVVINGVVGEQGLSAALMDVVAQKGVLVLAAAMLSGRPSENWKFSQIITLDTVCTDLEVRVWVTESTNLKILSINIIPI